LSHLIAQQKELNVSAQEEKQGGFMSKRLFFITLAAALAAGIGYADQSTAKLVVPVGRTAASSGKQMYASYCAPCHGVDGRGNGPMVRALRDQPADLSVLTRDNGGKFPAEHFAAVLQFGVDASAHGSAEMPIWGPVLGRMDVSAPQPQMRSLRISNLSHYIESMQAK